jgi:hypothetical protein
MKKLYAVLLALALPAAAIAGDSLVPFKAEYVARWKGRVAGVGELHLEQQADGRWSYSSRVDPRGWARLVPGASQRSLSVFHITDGRVVPESLVASADDQRIHYDWSANRVTGHLGRRRFNLPVQPGLLDELSVQVALMQELLAGRKPERFVLIDEGRIKDYLYAAEGTEMITSPAGTHRTEIFSSRRPGSRKATYFWCAPELGYIPLKVERRDGQEVEWSMTLQNLTR